MCASVGSSVGLPNGGAKGSCVIMTERPENYLPRIKDTMEEQGEEEEVERKKKKRRKKEGKDKRIKMTKDEEEEE